MMRNNLEKLRFKEIGEQNINVNVEGRRIHTIYSGRDRCADYFISDWLPQKMVSIFRCTHDLHNPKSQAFIQISRNWARSGF